MFRKKVVLQKYHLKATANEIVITYANRYLYTWIGIPLVILSLKAGVTTLLSLILFIIAVSLFLYLRSVTLLSILKDHDEYMLKKKEDHMAIDQPFSIVLQLERESGLQSSDVIKIYLVSQYGAYYELLKSSLLVKGELRRIAQQLAAFLHTSVKEKDIRPGL